MSHRSLEIRTEVFPVRGAFVIARSRRTEATMVTVMIEQQGVEQQVLERHAAEGRVRGWGECAPSDHYGESPRSVVDQIESVRPEIEAGAGREQLLSLLPAGAARNGIDSALWDLEARLAGRSVAQLAGLGGLDPVTTVCTISIGTAQAMASEASRLAETDGFGVLKLKLDGKQDMGRVEAVRSAAPAARLIVDANESWPPIEVPALLEAMADLGVELVEQPTSPQEDEVLRGFDHPIPVCADEAFHTVEDLDRMVGRYDCVNLKLDKTGGLTHALAAQRAARERGFGVMVGCMLGTSLAMAPGLILAQDADYIDLDGPLLLEKDRDPSLEIGRGGRLSPNPHLWGG